MQIILGENSRLLTKLRALLGDAKVLLFIERLRLLFSSCYIWNFYPSSGVCYNLQIGTFKPNRLNTVIGTQLPEGYQL